MRAERERVERVEKGGRRVAAVFTADINLRMGPEPEATIETGLELSLCMAASPIAAASICRLINNLIRL